MNRDHHHRARASARPAASTVIAAAIAASCLAGCTTNTVTIADVSPRPTSVFGIPRPAVVAELQGQAAVVPSRAAVGGSWVKRHLATERGRLEAFAGEPRREAARDEGAAERPGPAHLRPGRPGGAGVKAPARTLKPSDFDPNHLI